MAKKVKFCEEIWEASINGNLTRVKYLIEVENVSLEAKSFSVRTIDIFFFFFFFFQFF